MSMKKRLATLVLTGAMVVPAVGNVFANPTQVYVPKNGGSKTHEITMNVGVADDTGVIEGQVMVEVPTVLDFAVTKDGKVPTQTLTVKNLDTASTVKVAVDSFAGGNANTVEVVPALNTGMARNKVKLTLTGDNNQSINLGDIVNQPASPKDILTVAPTTDGKLVLTGEAGSGNLAKSVTETFKLILRLSAN
jgi:hypothetical protein